MSRALTVDEVREEFLNHARSVARYWAGLDGSNVPEEYTPIQRTMGSVFTLLAAIDGCSMGLPGFELIPNPHPDDMQYAISEHEDYFPSGGDIAGCLHELFHKPEDSGDE